MCLICFKRALNVFHKRRQISSRPGSVSHVNAKNKNILGDIPSKRDIPARRDHVKRPLAGRRVKGIGRKLEKLIYQSKTNLDVKTSYGKISHS